MKSSTKGKNPSYNSQSVGRFQHRFPETPVLCKELTVSSEQDTGASLAELGLLQHPPSAHIRVPLPSIGRFENWREKAKCYQY